MKERWLFCEGQTDAPVLKAVFAALGYDVIAESTGGNPGKIARWRTENGVTAASISDRDYRPLEDCDASYKKGSMKFRWRRHSIENYLLEPEVVSKAVENIKRSLQAMPNPPICTEALPQGDLEAIRKELSEAAKQIIHKECGCFCVHGLWVDLKESLGRIQQRVPAMFTSAETATMDECVTELQAEAARLMSVIKVASSANELKDSEIVHRYADQLMKLQQTNYWQDMTFLHEFHGKRLFGEVLQQLNRTYGFRPSPALFYAELTNAIESIAIVSRDAKCLEDFRQLGESVLSL